jgi:hypothetical protein
MGTKARLGRHPQTAVGSALARRGISERAFDKLALRAIEEVPVDPAAADPHATFTELEAAILTSGGLDLRPRRLDEPDVVVQTAIGLALVELKAAPVAELAQTMRVTPARVRQRALERTLYAVRVDDEWRFPRWQLDQDGRPIPGIASVTAALPAGVHPVAVQRFMITPNPDLEIDDAIVSPLDWLRTGGDPGPVAAIAAQL